MQHGAPAGLVARLVTSFGLQVTDVTEADAERAADLWKAGSRFSLADRLCLALGLRLSAPVVTTDAAWRSVKRGPKLILVR
jgi:ribonuclease VapC